MSDPAASTQADAVPSRIFLSYAHEDRREKDALMVQLAPLERQSLISTWSDERIGPGEEWLKAIDQALDSAAVGVLLISANFLASEFIQSREVPKLLERHASDTVVYPIIIKPCPWQAVDWLNGLQVRPIGGEPVWRDDGRFAERDLAEIALELARIAGRRMEPSAKPRRSQSSMPMVTPDSVARPVSFNDLKQQAIAAIQVGAPEYNGGNVEACARRYARVVNLVQRNGIEGAVVPRGEADAPMAGRPHSMPARQNSMPSGRTSMPGRRKREGINAETFISSVAIAELAELYATAGSISPGSNTEALDRFAWQARYCFDRTLDVAEIADLAVEALNNPRLQQWDIQRIFERIDRAASAIYWPDWPQKLTDIDSGIKLVASMLSTVISGFLSAGILEGKEKMPAETASELESVVREYDESGEDPYRLVWMLHSFMVRFSRRV